MSETLVHITNYATYTEEMRKSVTDKLYFWDIIHDFENIVDYGCADGFLISQIQEKLASQRSVGLFGIDMDEEMIERAKNICPGAQFFVGTTPSISMPIAYENSMINFSSVLHEIYSYCSEEEIQNFWEGALHTGYKYIVIRDMACNLSDELTEQSDLEKLYAKEEIQKKLQEFESVWGSVKGRRNFLHFLMKYRYDLNWTREVKENYLPMSSAKLKQIFAESDYEPVYFETFTLPFLQNFVEKDLGIMLKDTTHVKAIYRRRN